MDQWAEIDKALAEQGLRRAGAHESGWYVPVAGGKIWATDLPETDTEPNPTPQFQVGDLFEMQVAGGGIETYKITALLTATPYTDRISSVRLASVASDLPGRAYTVEKMAGLIAKGTFKPVVATPALTERFKVGDRVELLAREDDNLVWFPGSIIGTGTNPVDGEFWRVKLDNEPSVLAWHAVPKIDEAECLRPSESPAPAESVSLTKPASPLPFYEGDTLHTGAETLRIIGVNSEQLFLGRANGATVKFSKQYVRARLKAGDWKLIAPAEQSERPFQVGDIFYVKYGSHWVLMQVAICYAERMTVRAEDSGDIKNFAYDWVRLQLSNGNLRLPSPDEQLTFLHNEADRLDQQVVDTMSQLARIQARIAVLKAWRG